jgi:hypothetical protein
MLWVYTSANIAFMKDAKTVGDGAAQLAPYHAMRPFGAAVRCTDLAVSVAS